MRSLVVSMPLSGLFIFGLGSGVLDMSIFGSQHFRVGEILLFLAFLIFGTHKLFTERYIRPFTVFLALGGIALCAFYLWFESSSQFTWLLKTLIFFAIAATSLRIENQRLIDFSSGLCSGYLFVAFCLILLGKNFDAKYVAPQTSLFLLLSLVHWKKTQGPFMGLLTVVSILVAFLSNSRGQLILLMLVVLFMAIAAYGRMLGWLVTASLLQPILYIVSMLLILFKAISVLTSASGADFNAGDLERSTMTIYALSSCVSYPFGQGVDGISERASDLLSSVTMRSLQTVSAHNIAADFLLYCGLCGAVMMAVLWVRFYRAGLQAIRIPQKKLRMTVAAALLIGWFVLSTSPVAGAERVEFILCMLLIGAASSGVESRRDLDVESQLGKP